MATVTLTIPDAQLNRVVHALAVSAGIPVAQETPAVAKAVVVAWIKSVVSAVEQDAELKARPPAVVPDVSGVVT